MLSPLMIVSLDQGKLYGPKPTLDEIEARTAADFGLAQAEAGAAPKSRSNFAWTARLRKWLTARAGKPQPDY